MNKIYYKVVTRDLKSAIMNSYVLQDRIQDEECQRIVDKFCVQYKINEWVNPNVGKSKIMIFKDLISAKDFCLTNQYDDILRIYTCKCKNVSQLGFVTDVLHLPLFNERYINLLNLKRQKRKVKDYYKKYERRIVPNNTLFCSSVMLLKEIKDVY